MLSALQPQLAVVQQLPVADLHARVEQLEDHAATALRRLEGELQRLAVAGIPFDSLDLVELLDARLRLPGACPGAEARDETLEAVDLCLLALDRPAQREFTSRLLLAPCAPRAGEESSPSGLELQHARAHRLQEPAVVGDEHDRRIEADQ